MCQSCEQGAAHHTDHRLRQTIENDRFMSLIDGDRVIKGIVETVAVAKEKEKIALAIDIIVESFQKGGRLFYVGAGTSGRLAFWNGSVRTGCRSRNHTMFV